MVVIAAINISPGKIKKPNAITKAARLLACHQHVRTIFRLFRKYQKQLF